MRHRPYFVLQFLVLNISFQTKIGVFSWFNQFSDSKFLSLDCAMACSLLEWNLLQKQLDFDISKG